LFHLLLLKTFINISRDKNTQAINWADLIPSQNIMVRTEKLDDKTPWRQQPDKNKK